MNKLASGLSTHDDDRFDTLLVDHLSGQLGESETAELWRFIGANPDRCHELMSCALASRD